MNRLVFFVLIIFTSVSLNAQDFSYLKDIDVNETNQYEEAEEAALECCCYLTGVRYDKKDNQRRLATEYISDWMSAVYAQSYSLEELFEESTEQSEVYQVFFALNYIEYKDELSLSELQAEALKGVVSYCSNSSNKLKMTKALKEIQKMIETETLQDNIENSGLVIAVQ